MNNPNGKGRPPSHKHALVGLRGKGQSSNGVVSPATRCGTRHPRPWPTQTGSHRAGHQPVLGLPDRLKGQSTPTHLQPWNGAIRLPDPKDGGSDCCRSRELREITPAEMPARSALLFPSCRGFPGRPRAWGFVQSHQPAGIPAGAARSSSTSMGSLNGLRGSRFWRPALRLFRADRVRGCVGFGWTNHEENTRRPLSKARTVRDRIKESSSRARRPSVREMSGR